MALIRNWNIQALDLPLENQTTGLNVNKSTMFALKQFLTGQNPVVGGDIGLWTVEQSSNGTAVVGAGGNWASRLDCKWHLVGSAHSWIEFKSPAGFVPGGNFVYLLIDLQGSGADVGTENVYFTMSGESRTGGTTLNAPTPPTLTPESVIGNGAPIQFLRIVTDPVPRTGKWHGVRNTVGDCWFFFSRTGTGYCQTAFGISSLLQAETGHAFPSFGFASFRDTLAGGLMMDRITFGPNVMGLWKDGRGCGNQHPFIQTGVLPLFGSPTFLEQVNNGGSDITGFYYDVAAEVVGIDTGIPAVARMGVIPDVSLAPAHPTVIQLDGQPFVGTNEKAIVGHGWLPFTPTKPVGFI